MTRNKFKRQEERNKAEDKDGNKNKYNRSSPKAYKTIVIPQGALNPNVDHIIRLPEHMKLHPVILAQKQGNTSPAYNQVPQFTLPQVPIFQVCPPIVPEKTDQETQCEQACKKYMAAKKEEESEKEEDNESSSDEDEYEQHVSRKKKRRQKRTKRELSEKDSLQCVCPSSSRIISQPSSVNFTNMRHRALPGVGMAPHSGLRKVSPVPYTTRPTNLIVQPKLPAYVRPRPASLDLRAGQTIRMIHIAPPLNIPQSVRSNVPQPTILRPPSPYQPSFPYQPSSRPTPPTLVSQNGRAILRYGRGCCRQ